MSLIEELYKNIVLQTKRGNTRGIFSNAKPAFLLSIIDAIEEGYIVGNKIMYENIGLQTLYDINYRKYQYGEVKLYKANAKITPYNMPFFHLNAEPYYHIKWSEGMIPPIQSKSPSSKYLRNCVDYSFLDEKLWTLLQDSKFRESLRNALINKFFKTTNS